MSRLGERYFIKWEQLTRNLSTKSQVQKKEEKSYYKLEHSFGEKCNKNTVLERSKLDQRMCYSVYISPNPTEITIDKRRTK